MSVAPEQKERFHFLDGLRGIAAMMIVIHHAFTHHIIHAVSFLKVPMLTDFFTYFTQSGVDLFFVLSGVVLLRPYLRKQREFKTLDYFYRRAKRIYPPYFVALLFGALVVWINNTFPTWYNVNGLTAKFSWTETFKELFIVSFNANYYNLAWWSLQIEILFYVVAPFIVLIFPARDKITTRRIVVSIIITLCAIFLAQNLLTEYCYHLYSYTYQVPAFGKFIEYPLCFLLGVYLAARDFTLKQGLNFLFSGIILLVSALFLFRYAPSFLAGNFFGYEVVQLGVKQPAWIYLSFMHSGYALIYAGVIILAFNKISFKQFLSKPIMIWLGERSYSLFLIHFSVFYLTDNIISHFTTDRSPLYGVLTRGIGIPLGLFAAMLLFHFVERRQARGLLTGNIFWPWQVGKLNG
jgi:peptidoglycan/LPS O-acetylase OafA/YrhL